MHLFKLVWSPQGKPIAEIWANDARAAIRKAPRPYNRFLGEIYAQEILGAAMNPVAPWRTVL